MPEVLHTEVAVIGAGVLGLEVAQQFSAVGRDVTLLEAQPTLAAGPSTRNGRFLHRGSYYLAMIREDAKALRVGAGISRGYQRIRELAPEAIENGTTQTYALIYEGENKEHVLDRWGRGGIPYEAIPLAEFRARNTGIAIDNITFAARVNDKSIDTVKYYRKLRNDALANGATILTNAHVVEGSENSHKAQINIRGEEATLVADQFIVTAGYSAPAIHELVTGGDPLALELWKHHLVALPRATEHNMLALFPHRPYIINHGDVSVLGKNKSESPVAAADFDLIDEKVDELSEQARAFLPDADHTREHLHACVTLHVPDVPYYGSDGRMLRRGLWTFAWPGKMTSAPDVAADLVRDISPTLDNAGRHIEVFSSVPQGLPIPTIENYPYVGQM
jgi:glycine/D-amino acid oxidase-like deaminating enzyme